MLQLIDDNEYLSIIDSIIKNEEVQKMNNIKHHNTTRMEHSLKVSYYSYVIAKWLRLDYVETARGGLLHDFYLNRVAEQKNIKEKITLYTIAHPKNAVENAKKYFDLSMREEDIIRSHMFPVDFKVPKYAESWIVSFVDKGLSTGEFARKFGRKLAYALNVYLIFILNIMK